MDYADILVFVALILALISPLLLVLGITILVAYSRTRAWQKTRLTAHDPSAIESHPLNSSETANEDDEQDFLDSEDEAEYHRTKADEEADRHLTARQKFRKEFKKCWSGAGVKAVQEQKEREERRKIAKAVAREVARLERKRQRREEMAGGSGSRADAIVESSADGLPSYTNAVGVDRKQ